MFPFPVVNVDTGVYVVRFPGVAILTKDDVEELFVEIRLVVEDQVVFVNLVVLEFEEIVAVLGSWLELEFEGADVVDIRKESDAKDDEMILDV